MDRNNFGSIEVGGTKIVCGIGTNPSDIQTTIIETLDPESTIEKITEFFRQQPNPVKAIGIGCFGPLDLNQDSVEYGKITNSPKTAWNGINLKHAIEQSVGVRVAIDTDVNAAAIGEYHYGAARDYEDFVYITVGTGIGGGIMAAGKLVHGLLHPEVGHMRIPRANGDEATGNCSFHKDCWEGFASGKAMQERWGMAAQSLDPDHPGWELEAQYLACGLANLIMTISPKRIIIGGGVMNHTGLLAMVRRYVVEKLNGYIDKVEITSQIDSYIVSPELHNLSGVIGALSMVSKSEANS